MEKHADKEQNHARSLDMQGLHVEALLQSHDDAPCQTAHSLMKSYFLRVWSRVYPGQVKLLDQTQASAPNLSPDGYSCIGYLIDGDRPTKLRLTNWPYTMRVIHQPIHLIHLCSLPSSV